MGKVWTDDALALSQKLIHLQDKLTASLALAIHRGINTQNYGLVLKLLNTIEHDAESLERTAQDLIALRPKRKQGGRPPKWFEQAEEILYLALQTQRAIAQIRNEAIGNYWKLIGTRLTKCYVGCRKQQRELLNILPQEHATESDLAGPMTQLINTLEMGETTENRWRRTNH